MSTHAFLPPSGAAAWAKCPLWPTMNRHFPSDDTPESLEGNGAHWVAWEILASRQPNIGDVIPDNLGLVTEEMLQGGEMICDVIFAILTKAGMTVNDLHIEKKVNIHTIHEDCSGTPDVWFYAPSLGSIEIIDYKFGHRFVDEFENDQLIAYYAGIIEEISILFGKPSTLLDQLLIVNFTIVQPRCHLRGQPVRTWSVRASDLRAHINKLCHAAQLACEPEPKAVCNSECVDCTGRHACEVLQRSAYNAAELSGAGNIVELGTQAASLELRILQSAQSLLEARVTGLEEYVTAKVRSGERAPHHKLEQSQGRLNWSLPIDQIIAMGNLLNVDLSKAAVLTPNQAKKGRRG